MNYTDEDLEKFLNGDQPLPIHALAQDVKEARHHEKLLTEALRTLLVSANIIRPNSDPNGPELLMAASEWAAQFRNVPAKEMTKAEFDELAKGLQFIRPNLAAKVVHVEPIDPSYFRSGSVQRCIVELDGKIYLSEY